MANNQFVAKCICIALGTLVSIPLYAVPSVDSESVTLTQDTSSRLVTVKYKLTGDPAIVTVDFQTNNVDGVWTSIGGEKFSQVIGDVNKIVNKIDEISTIYWQPAKADAWPNQNIAGDNFRAVVKVWATNAPPPYMIVDLKDNPGTTMYYPSVEAIPGGITNDIYKTNRLAFRLVPAALVTWTMGAPSGENGQADSNREKSHKVTFTKDYYMGVYPVTQMQHYLFSGKTPSTSTNNLPETAAYPVESVLWKDLRGAYYDNDSVKGDWPEDGNEVGNNSVLYKARNVTGLPSLDLPTEAMWEYACRAGTSTATYAGNLTILSGEDPVLNRIAWCAFNSDGHTHPVGLKECNEWGFFDMLGNVGQLTLDKWSAAMSSDSVVDPTGPQSVSESLMWYRVYRGSGWDAEVKRVRAAFREAIYMHASSAAKPTVGYRVCCEAMALK